MTLAQITSRLTALGIPAGFIDTHEDEVSVDYETLHAKHTPELAAFIKTCSVSHTDKALFISAKA